MLTRFSILLSRAGLLVGWSIVNGLIALRVHSTDTDPIFLIWPLVVLGSPIYVLITHWLDENHNLLGLRHAMRIYKKLPTPSARRHTVRLQMLAITSGFAATLFFLSVQLYFDVGETRATRFVLGTMASLFFLSSVLNLVHILVYAFSSRVAPIKGKLTSGSAGAQIVKEMSTALKKKKDWFDMHSWNGLIIPAVLAFYLISPIWCVVINFVYGCVLFNYYFFPPTKELIDACNKLKSARSSAISIPGSGGTS